MQDVFFNETKNALSNITSIYDTVWPIATGLWNLRRMVIDAKKDCPEITEAQLNERFGVEGRACGVNYKRTFFESSWEKQQEDFAWILLNSTIPIFEGWLEELKQNIFSDLNIVEMQSPAGVQSEVARLTRNESAVLKDCFYSEYSAKRDRCYPNIDSLMHCYRTFKNARNCYMHNNLKANNRLVVAYSNYLPHATTSSLCVTEVPEFYAPVLNEPVKISLRGVVGFSYILIKILVSLDAELLRASVVEGDFISRYKARDNFFRAISPNTKRAEDQVAGYMHQCGYSTPQNVSRMVAFLLEKHLASR